MTEEQQTLLLIRGQIASLPADDQAAVHQAEAELRAVLQARKGHAMLALALLGAELAASD